MEEARLRAGYHTSSARYEQLFGAVFDSSALAIEITNMDGNIVASNPAYQALVGWSPQELSNMRYSDVVHPDDAEIDDPIFQSLVRGECDDYIVEKRFIHREGHTVHGNMHVSLIRDEDGKPLYAMGMIVDITELKRLEEFRHRFVADAAHELRGPVAALVGFAEILGERWEDLSPEQIKTTVDALKRQGHRLSLLTHALLDLSKIQRDRDRITVEPTDVRASAVALLDAEAPPPHVDVRIEVPPGLLALVEPSRFEQVLRNLLTNAYRYGGNNITIAARDEGGTVVITVEDDGDGIAPETQEKLFDPFWRGRNALSVEGSGLGLAIVSSLIAAMNGSISCRDRAPHGVAFEIVLVRAASGGTKG